MATQEQINAHDKLMADLADQFAAGLSPLFMALFDQILQLPSPTRLQIQQLFQEFRNYTNTQIQSISTVIQDNTQMNNLVLPNTIEPDVQQQIAQLQTEATAAINAQLDQEQTAIIAAIMIAAITGSVSQSVSQLRLEIPNFIRRLRLQFDTAVRSVDGAVTLLRGRKSEVRYRYSGGVIAESRDFCRQMSGQTLTESQIRRIWNTQDWGGKRPGDPFVTRGGWNCRHTFIPVGDNE